MPPDAYWDSPPQLPDPVIEPSDRARRACVEGGQPLEPVVPHVVQDLGRGGVAFLEWLEPFIYAYNEDYPLLIGYLNDDTEERPRLLWFKDRKLTLEDLNTDDTRHG